MKYFPVVFGGTFGALWSLFYLVLGMLSGMWKMTGQDFPFLISSLFVTHSGGMSPFAGAILAFVDGAAIGVLGGLFVRRLGRSREE